MCAEEEPGASCCCESGGMGEGAVSRAACSCGARIPRHFILPAVLLLLDEEPSHGYALFHQLSELGIMETGMSPATVYRVLSKLEEDGLAVHDYADDGQGPPRKVYTLTLEGREALARWRTHIEKTRELLDWFAEKTSQGQAS